MCVPCCLLLASCSHVCIVLLYCLNVLPQLTGKQILSVPFCSPLHAGAGGPPLTVTQRTDGLLHMITQHACADFEARKLIAQVVSHMLRKYHLHVMRVST